MTTRALKIGRNYKVIHESDPTYEGHDWHVIGIEDEECVDSCNTPHRAFVRMAELEAEIETEEAAERMAEIRWEIGKAIEDCEDESTLRTILAMLGK